MLLKFFICGWLFSGVPATIISIPRESGARSLESDGQAAQWVAGEWGACSKLCGDGYQSRIVVCKTASSSNSIDSFASFLPEDVCDKETKPEAIRTCNSEACNGAQWIVSKWQPCAGCGQLRRKTRSVLCYSRDGEIVPSAHCAALIREPRSVEPCDDSASEECSNGDAQWRVGEWEEECDCEDEMANQTRSVECANYMSEPNGNGTWNVLEDEDCDDAGDRPEAVQLCMESEVCLNETDSNSTSFNDTSLNATEELLESDEMLEEMIMNKTEAEWFVGAWDECSVECGNGTRERVVTCTLNEESVNETECVGEMPAQSQECNEEKCLLDKAKDIVLKVEEKVLSAVSAVLGNDTDSEDVDEVGEMDDMEMAKNATSCEDSEFGCCANQTTAATGPNEEGCDDCADSENGCCPDGVTAASGPEMEGCKSCNETEFGCCPDGVSVASGEGDEGCDSAATTYDSPVQLARLSEACVEYQYGCCADGETEAQGEGGLGCPETDCSLYQLGCCPDGMSTPSGEDDEGCPHKEVTKSFDCALDSDTGDGREFEIKWFYETSYGDCNRFWYGGDGGNGNKFDSERECQQTCVAPKGIAKCFLPQNAGPCTLRSIMWYYDQRIRSADNFIMEVV